MGFPTGDVHYGTDFSRRVVFVLKSHLICSENSRLYFYVLCLFKVKELRYHANSQGIQCLAVVGGGVARFVDSS